MGKTTETIKVNVPKAKVVDPVPSSDKSADAPAGMLKKAEVLDRLVAQSGVKRSDAKAIVEGFLSLLGEELRAEREMQLPPLGKLKLVKSKTVGQGATALTVKIRQPKPDTDDGD